ncbi:hypothetical protein SAMN05445756_2106 [Kytococcus aerolatus]|uniref:Uncharacterized protein n=1 Tax=Kytococcus aerolatus TaxID=592308 RepID=A0A212U633_9MICO|nr:hypothetical protein SAMN05445756_2106 [Kytococcus aerolatus]
MVDPVNFEKVVFGFFVLLAATMNFGYVLGDIGDPAMHNSYELYVAVLVNVVAAVLKLGDRTHVGAVHLAASLVACLQLGAASVMWVLIEQTGDAAPSTHEMASVVSVAAGALLANLVSLVILVVETVNYRGR